MGLIKRSRISKVLVDKLTNALAKGQSIVVIGPRHAGKTYLFNRIIKSLSDDYDLRAHLCSFYRDYPIQHEEEVADILRKHLPVIRQSARTVPEVFRELKQASYSQRKPTIVLLTHLDGIASRIARRILREVRPAVTADRPSLIVLLSGASNIVNLVRGPDSEFNCGHEYFVQGFDKELFEEFFTTWIERIGIQFDSATEACHHIWKLTRGNTSLCRRFLLSWVNNMVSGVSRKEAPLTKKAINVGFERLVSLGIHGAMIFQWASEMISSRPDCWPILEKLIDKGRVKMRDPEPNTLELAGAAELRKGDLFFTSPVMKDFLIRQFGLRQRADLFAQAGKWKEAFERYERSGVGYPRPANFQDEFVVAAVTRRLYAAFWEVDLERLRDYVTKSVRGLLGFEYVSWWYKNGNDHWRDSQHQIGLELGKIAKQALAKADQKIFGQVVKVGKIGLAVIVSGIIPGSYEALVVADITNYVELSLHRENVLWEILQAFLQAYSKKLDDLRQQRQQQFARALTEIATRAYADLFIKSGSPADVIHAATKDLLEAKLGFDVVFCAMMTSHESVLQVTSAFPPGDEFRSLKWLLDDNSLVSNCYRDGEQWVGPGGAPWPELDLRWVQNQDKCAGIAVRLRGEGDAHAGVLCVLYGSETLPDRKEVEILNEFAGQLSAALQQSRRVALLQSSLDRIPEPIVLFDKGICKKYANAPAARLLGVSPDWASDKEPPPGSALDLLLPLVRDSLIKKHRLVDFRSRIGDRAYRGAILTDALFESGHLIGALLHIQDESYYRQILDAYRSLEQSHDEAEILQRLQTIFQEMGHQWIRKYRVEGETLTLESWIDGGRLVGIPKFQLPKRDAEPQVTWRSIIEGRPYVFSWDKKRKFGEQFYTSRGLQVIASPNPPGAEALPKKPDDYWIDFPLMRGKNNVFGKLTLPCEETLSPERFEMFRVFSEMAGDIFERVSELPKAASSRERQLIAENIIRNFKTEIAASVKPLDITLALYQQLEGAEVVEGDSLTDANQQLYKSLINLRATIDSVRVVKDGENLKRHEGN